LGSARSTTVTQNQFPSWKGERIRMELPPEIADQDGRALDDLYIHVKLWDWDFMKADDLIGEFAYPLKRVVTEPAMNAHAFSLQEVRKEFQNDVYDLRKSRIVLKFSLARKEKKQKKKRDLASRAREQISNRPGAGSDNFTDFSMKSFMPKE